MAGRPPPPKPWERASGTPSCCSNPTSDSLPKPWERPQGATETITPSSTVSALAAATPDAGSGSTALAVSRPNPARPWERPGTGSAVGAITPFGTSMYGSSYSSPYSSSYGGGYGSMYSSPYSRPYGSYGGYGGYGSSMYGSGGMYGGSSMYGGGMYGGGAYSGGMLGRPMGMPGPFDPNDPMGPPAPPSTWQAMLQSIQGVMHFFGRLSFLVDENAHAVHFFVTALLQLLDRFGSLYGELARFVLRLLGFKSAGKRQRAAGKGQEVGGVEAQAPSSPAAVGAAGATPHAGGVLRQRPVAAGLPLGGGSGGGGAGEWNSLWGSAPGGS